MRKLLFVLLAVFVFSTAADAAKIDSFYMENNTALNFMNGYYIIDIFEINLPDSYVKVNLTTGGMSRDYFLRENEDPYIIAEPFNKIKLNASFITKSSTRITVEYPNEWLSPDKYTVTRSAQESGAKASNIVVTKSVDKTAINIGDIVVIKIIAKNAGNATANNLTITEVMPPGFSLVPGSRFPPIIKYKLDPGESDDQISYALKAVEPGTYSLDPTTVRYDATLNRSNSVTITVATEKRERSNLTTVITPDKKNVFTYDYISVVVRVTNVGNVSAESILIDGAPPQGMELVEGDLRQVFNKIAPDDFEVYTAILRAKEPGDYSIRLKTIYNDDPTGSIVDSEPIAVVKKEINYFYFIIPIVLVSIGVIVFTLRKHKEYRY